MSKKLEYKDYKVTLQIGLANAEQSDTIHPSEEFTQEQWDAMTPSKQKKWLDDSTRNWAHDYIEYWWE